MNDKNRKAMFAKGGSKMYRDYLEKYPNSHIAHDVKTWNRVGGHGGFGEALMNGEYADAWFKADLSNQKKMMELGFGTKYKDYDRDMTPHRLQNIADNYKKRNR